MSISVHACVRVWGTQVAWWQVAGRQGKQAAKARAGRQAGVQAGNRVAGSAVWQAACSGVCGGKRQAVCAKGRQQ